MKLIKQIKFNEHSNLKLLVTVRCSFFINCNWKRPAKLFSGRNFKTEPDIV